MIFDAPGALRFALRAIGLAALLAIGVTLGIALVWRWPLNFAGAVGLIVVGYVLGRFHEAELATRPAITIAPLPKATARRSSR